MQGDLQQGCTSLTPPKEITTQWEVLCAHKKHTVTLTVRAENEVIVCLPCKAVMQAFSICMKEGNRPDLCTASMALFIYFLTIPAGALAGREGESRCASERPEGSASSVRSTRVKFHGAPARRISALPRRFSLSLGEQQQVIRVLHLVDKKRTAADSP